MAVYTVKAGDSLWQLAQAWGTTVKAIQAANKDVDPANELQVGQQINQPGRGQQQASNNGGRRVYTIQAGDTFSALAQKWGTTVEAIQAANPTVEPMKLQVGQLINRPGGVVSGSRIDIDYLMSRVNEYRAWHQAPPAYWDEGLAQEAQNWVDYLAATGQFYHGGTDGTGQNLFGSGGVNDDDTAVCLDATNTWYNEVERYDFNNPGFSQETGHFTQVVWKESTSVGYAVARGPGVIGIVVAGHYRPPGNFTNPGAFEENVLPRV